MVAAPCSLGYIADEYYISATSDVMSSINRELLQPRDQERFFIPPWIDLEKKKESYRNSGQVGIQPLLVSKSAGNRRFL